MIKTNIETKEQYIKLVNDIVTWFAKVKYPDYIITKIDLGNNPNHFEQTFLNNQNQIEEVK